jgi:hypothetical protein
MKPDIETNRDQHETSLDPSRHRRVVATTVHAPSAGCLHQTTVRPEN